MPPPEHIGFAPDQYQFKALGRFTAISLASVTVPEMSPLPLLYHMITHIHPRIQHTQSYYDSKTTLYTLTVSDFESEYLAS